MKYRKKPVIIEAEQFLYSTEKQAKYGAPTGDMFMEYPIWIDSKGPYIEIPTMEGALFARNRDWIITGVKGERYPCNDEIFKSTYEVVTD